MAAGSSFVNTFTGAAVKPSQVSYLALSISANTTLYWPTETVEGVPYVATQLDVTPTAAALQLQMPPATSGALGQATVITNVGSETFTLTDNDGNAIAMIVAGVSWLITLTTNATNAGTWRALQLASTVSTAVAASLAGAGLEANGSRLQEHILTTTLAVDSTLLVAHRAMLINWTGAAGTLQLDPIATLTAGWFCYITNNGTDTLTLATSGGETINELPEPVFIFPGGGVIVVCDTANFNTVGIQIPPAPRGTLHDVLFLVNGTFVTPSNSTTSTVYKCTVTGGGAGGGAGTENTGAIPGGGGGGGAGGTSIIYLSNLLPGTSVAVVVGVGGVGAVTVSGTDGTASTLIIGSVTVIGNGGKGGILSAIATSTIAMGGAGGTATGGSINLSGASGGWGWVGTRNPTDMMAGGIGGPSFWGGGGSSGVTSESGVGFTAAGAAVNPGSGGGGGAGGAGADGADGQVLIEYVL